MKLELENYMTINEFMAKHKIKSRRTVYNWIESGKLDIKKVLDRTVVKLK